MVDFDQAQYNELQKALGADLAKNIIRGCSIHWKTSVNRMNKIVTKSGDEFDIFRNVAYCSESYRAHLDPTKPPLEKRMSRGKRVCNKHGHLLLESLSLLKRKK